MSSYDEQGLAELLRALPAAPEGWVKAAQELPRAIAEVDGLIERAVADAEYRKAVLADLEAALRETGHEPDPARIAALRARLA
ncbi:MAG: hypothetical protein M3312_02970 [Actinomycetota bacterium]|nr:hypothetical protein [Actinomycetota bacterium]